MSDSDDNWEPFPGMLGEGTIIVNRVSTQPFSIKIRSEYKDCWIGVKIEKDKASFLSKMEENASAYEICSQSQCENGKYVSYWLSFNRDDRELKYGRGYVMSHTTILSACILEGHESVFDPTKKKFYQIYPPDGGRGDDLTIHAVEDSHYFHPYPLINDLPPLVKNSANATMLDISSTKFILSANLPVPCQQLYSVIASPNVKLDSELSDAINYSMTTEGKALYKKLHPDNEDEHKDDMSQYLRIGIGDGSSPGIPFVLELWPPGSKSQIHNHGNVYGIIKVIRGSIDIHVYNKTWEDDMDKHEILQFRANEGAVTWLSPNWYQTHHLENSSNGKDDFCATIQCYKYGSDDQIMWPYFDYVTKKEIEEYKPRIHYQFREMCKIVLKEYAEPAENHDE